MRSNTLQKTILLLLVLAALGCGGGGSGGGDDDDGGGGGNPTPLCINFGGGTASAPSTATSAKGTGSICNTVIVEVAITDVNDVFTVAFDASYDANVARYDGYSLDGSHLTSDGAGVDVIETESPGEVHLGITRLNPAVGINFTGTKTVVKLMFAKASGVADGDNAALGFSGTQVIGSEQPPVEKGGIAWFGGTLSVN